MKQEAGPLDSLPSTAYRLLPPAHPDSDRLTVSPHRPRIRVRIPAFPEKVRPPMDSTPTKIPSQGRASADSTPTKIPVQGQAGAALAITASCPYCGRHGELMPVTEDTIVEHNTYIGLRRCPDEKCHGIV